MLTHEGLVRDVKVRIQKIQDMMKKEDYAALVIIGGGAPGGMGAIRYITNAHLWGGAGYAVLGQDDPDPYMLIWSSYQAVWTRNETTTLKERVEAPGDLMERVKELVTDYAGNSGKRIGVVNMKKLLPLGAYESLQQAIGSHDLIDATEPYNDIRQIKSPFELEAVQQNGYILDACMDVFADNSYVGAKYWDVCAATEAFVKAKGAFWGRTKLSLDLTPFTVPTAKDLTMSEDDIINFEIVYESPWGYWTEMTTVFSFIDLPDDVQLQLDAYLAAVDASSAVARTGNTFNDISNANDKAIADMGLKVAGKHTPDCHSTGLDGSDGPSSFSHPDFVLKSNMILSYHPGTVLENDKGFLITDNFMVTDEGAVRLSPHNADRYYIRLSK
jgi:Xaa-Pro aminopeptidase